MGCWTVQVESGWQCPWLPSFNSSTQDSHLTRTTNETQTTKARGMTSSLGLRFLHLRSRNKKQDHTHGRKHPTGNNSLITGRGASLSSALGSSSSSPSSWEGSLPRQNPRHTTREQSTPMRAKQNMHAPRRGSSNSARCLPAQTKATATPALSHYIRQGAAACWNARGASLELQMLKAQNPNRSTTLQAKEPHPTPRRSTQPAPKFNA